mmetsp:Transcript_19708/g.30427  ORF Transcript_19708/g.30427 Transcript_19708/m.30427 type:complete len:119 (+) Transcript_19708:1331-1687(+)
MCINDKGHADITHLMMKNQGHNDMFDVGCLSTLEFIIMKYVFGKDFISTTANKPYLYMLDLAVILNWLHDQGLGSGFENITQIKKKVERASRKNEFVVEIEKSKRLVFPPGSRSKKEN